MTSHTDEIHQLIADIDHLLSHSGKGLSKFLSNQGQQEKEVLQRVREFLVQLEEDERSEPEVPPVATTNSSPTPAFSSLLTQFNQQGNLPSVLESSPPPAELNNIDTVQIKQELTVLLQPLKAELSRLLTERASLIQEIRELEQKRLQNYSLSQQLANQEQMISEFLEVLMGRLVPHLQSNANLTNNSNHQNLEAVTSAIQPILESAERVEQLASLARDLDQRLLSLDGTVNIVFEALERNINTYYQSLSQALAKMHSQGMQGEQLMANFLNNLTQYLQQQSLVNEPLISGINTEVVASASSLLSQSPAAAELPLETPAAEIEPITLGTDLLQEQPQSAKDLQLAIADEVDELYASFFNTEISTPLNLSFAHDNTLTEDDNLSITPAVVSNDLSAPEIYDSTDDSLFIAPVVVSNDLSAPEIHDSTDDSLSITPAVVSNDLSAPEIHDSIVSSMADITPSIMSAEPKAELPIIENLGSELQDDENDNPQTIISDVPKEVAVTSLPEATPVKRMPTEPNSADTITVLTDLLVDTGNEELSLEVNTGDTSMVTLPPITASEDQDLGLDNYVLASSTDDLLSLVDHDVSGIPEIVLDAKQLQQLDQDLANFDQPLTASGASKTNLDHESLDNESQIDTVIILPSQEVDSTLTTETSIEDKKEDFSHSQPAITSQQSPITSPQPSIPHDENNDLIPADTLDATWYLGIDVGTTGISAALLNRSKLIVYPIYWSAETQTGGSSFQQSFRLPAEVYLPTNSSAYQSKSDGEAFSQSSVPQHLYSAQLKPFLQIAVPYQQERQKWEPMLQLNEFSAGPLIWVVRSLSKLLLTLRSSQTSTTPALIANAVGMNTATFSKVIKNIAGIICTCPSSWTEQYRFNIREAILTSQLVSHPQQIFFVEEAIASLLPELDSANGQPIKISENQGFQALKTSDYPLLGSTLAINMGATVVEMTLVDIPANLGELTHKDFMLHNFAYSGKGIEQDIICQLLLPPKSRQPRQPGQSHHESANTNPWHWQPSIPGLDQMQFSSLGLETLTLPKVGEPDIQARIQFQQRLESSLLGQALLDAALALKLILQHQETFTLEFADQSWILQRRDLESQVFVPFVRRLNRELNKLLVARGIPTEAINQAILSGGVASVGTINRWLRQKLPNAKIIQDLYLGENGAPNCSRVALGLAILPLHPQVLDIAKQQYTDYFLFYELLKLLPNRSLSFGEVLQLFESRGINTRICQQRLLAFLEGELPPGLIPAASNNLWLTHHSQENPDYKAIAALTSGISPLFEKQGNLSYRPNYQQVQLLLRYLDAIKSSTIQSLEEPYSYLLQSQV